MPTTDPNRPSPDPSPRTLEQMYREIKSLEEKLGIKFSASEEAVRLLQEFANRQPTTEAVHGELTALEKITDFRIDALKELINEKFDGNKTALDAALKTQKEASDKLETNFGKQLDGLTKSIDENKDRINRADGRTKGLGDFLGWIVAAVAIVGGLAAFVAR